MTGISRLVFALALMLSGCGICSEQATIVDYNFVTCKTTFLDEAGNAFEGLGVYGKNGDVVTVNRCDGSDAWSLWWGC